MVIMIQRRRMRIGRSWILGLLVSQCFLTTAHGQGTSAGFVQGAAGATAGSSSSLSLSFPANTVAGDLLLVAFDYDTSAIPSSVTDFQGNVFTAVGSQLTSPGGARSRVYYAKNIKGGADTVTVNLSANSGWLELYLTEYSGADQTNPIDAQAGASGNAGAVSSGNATTTAASDVIYGYCVGDWVCTAGSGFATRSNFHGNLIEDKLAGNAGTYAATGSATNGWTMQVVALKPASSVAGAPAITSATTVSGTVGRAFSYQITATNSPTSYGATGLPAGLSVSSTTGLISGTPTTAGKSTVTLSATNGSGTGNATLTLTINAGSPAITSATTASGTVGTAFSYQITATNSPTSYGATGFPTGLSVSSTTGLISGTPTTAGKSTVTLSATNGSGTGNATLTLTINAGSPAITSATTASGTVGTAFSYQITATNSPTSYGATGLPTGLSVSSTTGLISGTPTTAGTSTVTLSATNSSGTGQATLMLAVGSTRSQLIAVSSDGRYLVNPSTGKPVFLVGDAPQDIAEMLDSAQVTQYLNDRSSRGFNALWIMITDKYQTNPPLNNYGYAPFDGADFTNEDVHYFANVDSIVTQASDLGITVFLMPFFVGNGNEPGYITSVLNSSDEVMTAYGTFLGNRYKDYDNIVWVLGGDSFPSVSGLYQKLSDVGAAIAAADPNHLITVDACEHCVLNGYNSVQAYQAQSLPVPSWLKLNWAYPQLTTTVAAAQNAYNQSPFLPPMCGENYYELENSLTELQIRFEQYSEVLSGCYVGRIFGNGAIWSFDSPNGSPCCRNGSPTWETELSSAGSASQEYQGRLFRSREHWLLVPDINHTVVTAGYGSGLTVTTAARTSDGQTIIAYIPNGNATTIAVNMARTTSASSSVQGWWFNPRAGTATNLGTFANTGTYDFTPPDSNDWVLVLDDASANLPAPSSGSPAP